MSFGAQSTISELHTSKPMNPRQRIETVRSISDEDVSAIDDDGHAHHGMQLIFVCLVHTIARDRKF